MQEEGDVGKRRNEREKVNIIGRVREREKDE